MGEAGTAPVVATQFKRLTRIEATVSRMVSRKRLCILGFALFPVMLRLALLPWIPSPQPVIHDEFSNLLAGDTFASGRLTNPPHPYWVFFESFHIIQQPTYMSKYPPLAGIILAVGQCAFGLPWIGILLSVGFLCGALAWAMYNWLPPFWALAGSILAVLKIGILSYWSESYWGGTSAAIGGTLLVGSLPVMIRRPNSYSGFAAAVGIALLANSRPLEGLLLTVFCLGYAALKIPHRRGTPGERLRTLSRGILIPVLVTMVPVGTWMAYYNLRVTGNALIMPYVAHERQYASATPMWWVKPRTLVYHHEIMRDFWVGWDASKKAFQRDHFLLTRLPSVVSVEQFYLGLPLLLLIAVNAKTIAKSRRARVAFWLLMAFLAGLSLELEFLPHYAAPASVLFYIVAASALRALRHWKPQRTWVRPLIGTAMAGIAVELVLAAFQPAHRFLFDKRDFQAQRAHVLSFLDRVHGKQLVFVRYGPKHDIHHEWVYNRADIDSSAIVWARSMGQKQDAKLMAYYPERHVWLLEENGTEQISPYNNGSNTVVPE